ncbi:hypothetical protein LMG3458_06191 [Achromobacter deleyi]|uniref:DUF3304 domain-containing protein n=1 Tax=Achromobacter deleyi TaxID=1353891 RepID=A0A6S7C8W2_9BURK|nr:DUF3304 domain-containing protein [Achromobacter deleyi]CAB3743875.1 hypothetical protein LMG3458_06191 [Achromobacter deleyi]CAB3881020.1 hypothetical protein LMG3482_03294 [Achromobacter deleyi]CAB3927120.1 hypothetical protein LMG3481_05999 [Achromobacter deleyi]
MSAHPAAAMLVLAVLAFVSPFAAAQSAPVPETLDVRLGIINYLDEGLDPVFINQGWAGNARLRSYSSGTCCVSIPTKWKPGMTMRVQWRSDSMFKRGEKEMMTRDAPVLPYQPFHDGYVWAVFLPGGEVRLQPSDYGPGGPGFLQGLPQPGEATEAELKQFIEKTQPKP